VSAVTVVLEVTQEMTCAPSSLLVDDLEKLTDDGYTVMQHSWHNN